ncbi:uncharacterized protein Dere_GG26806 [Drosophila erecta]|uniref:Uncharacterized protein n=1 Tax=Drosophila erecta TaxID=7220 RepID=A0A0Q5WLE7_DROER|nr:uncharacterized protein Dere_GG26806 [Drosophila erecta]
MKSKEDGVFKGNKTKYISPNRRKRVFIHRNEQLPIGYDEQDPRVLKDRNYLASLIQKRYPAEKDPRNLRRLEFLQEYPEPSSVEDLQDIKYASQLEGSHDSTKYNKQNINNADF